MESRKIKDETGAEYTVDFQLDEKSSVWIAVSDDIDGLILESPSLDELMNRVMKAAPELIELNRLPKRNMLRFSANHNARMAFA